MLLSWGLKTIVRLVNQVSNVISVHGTLKIENRNRKLGFHIFTTDLPACACTHADRHGNFTDIKKLKFSVSP